jgi:nucleoside-diphosphate-sugar epimerase
MLNNAFKHPGQPITVSGDGKHYQDFVFFDDVVEALLLIVRQGLNKGAKEIGSGRAITIRQLVGTIANIVGDHLLRL